MENSSPVRTGLYYGLLNGIGCFVIFIIIYFMGKNPMGNWSWLGFWIPILFMVIGVKVFRDKESGGAITYGRALATSFLVAFSGAVVVCLLSYLFCLFIATDVVSMMIDDSVKGIEKAKAFIGEEMYDKAMTGLEEMKNDPAKALFRMSMGNLFWKSFGGFILSLIVAAFMKKDKDLFANQPL